MPSPLKKLKENPRKATREKSEKTKKYVGKKKTIDSK